MTFSVNTNTGAMAALQNLSATNRNLDVTQGRINTGLRVSGTKDDSAAYTIAQKLRGDVGGLAAVTSSLSRAKSTVDVAIAGAEQISDLMNQMRSKVLEASDSGLDSTSKAQITVDVTALQTQIKSIIKSSTFNGTNLLDASTGPTASIAALKSADTTDTLTVAHTDLASSLGTIASGTVTMADFASAEANMKTVLSTLGSAARQLDGQLSFTGKLSDVIESGIGNLVDADLAKESAKLQGLQVKQQLGLQALSIANQSPQSIMSLFR
ncbi:flagellin [Sphingomonas parva]|uniref:Flagellin n=1 Tax=Sphingomonas parva TaxID=2555898 RepID=A0A4Y8ZN07_9SPHN|nr:flagellin [Sphingomonas parva]TFI56837.1 flagellin [Sphingomonas parva]